MSGIYIKTTPKNENSAYVKSSKQVIHYDNFFFSLSRHLIRRAPAKANNNFFQFPFFFLSLSLSLSLCVRVYPALSLSLSLSSSPLFIFAQIRECS
jgi:hypothetical protein